MPQPIRKNAAAGVGSIVLIRRPELGAMIAAIASAWAMVEDELGILLADMLTADRVPATQMFYAIGSLSARLDALRAVGKAQLPERLYRHLSDTLIPEIRKRSRERAMVVHAQWGENTRYPDGIILVPPLWTEERSTFYLYKREDFQEILDRIEQLVGRLVHFRTLVERGEPPEESC